MTDSGKLECKVLTDSTLDYYCLRMKVQC